MRRLLQRFRQAARLGIRTDSRGMAAVEFGLVFPVFILIVVGTLEFGRALEARNEMSRALSQAVRVVNLDATQSTSAVATLISTYLDDYAPEDLTINATTTTISGIDYMDVSVTFPFDVIIPFSAVSGMTLDVATRAPLISATQ